MAETDGEMRYYTFLEIRWYMRRWNERDRSEVNNIMHRCLVMGSLCDCYRTGVDDSAKWSRLQC